MKANFGEVFDKYKKVHAGLLKNMSVVDRSGNLTLSKDEWEVATLYTAFAFQKKSSEDNKEPSLPSKVVLGAPRKYAEDEVLQL